MAKYTQEIANYAKIYNDTFVNESCEKDKVEENDMLKGKVHNGHLNEKENEDQIEEADKDVDVEKAVEDANKSLSSVKEPKDVKKFLQANDDKIKKLREALKKNPEALKNLDNILSTLDNVENMSESDELDEAKGHGTGFMTVIRGLLKIILTLSTWAFNGVGFTGKILTLAMKWLSVGTQKLNNMLKDSENEEVKEAIPVGQSTSAIEPVDMAARRKALMDKVAQRNRDAAPKIGPKEQHIKSIWVKDMIIDPIHDDKSVAKLEIEYVDGTKENIDFNIGTTGTSGDRYVNADKLYKDVKSRMPGATDKDIRLSLIRIAFNDYRINWYYGPNKVATNNWTFDPEISQIGKSAIVQANKMPWIEKTNKAAFWKSDRGTTTIYRTESESDLDESIKTYVKNNKNLFV